MVEWKKLGDLGSFENIGVDKKIVDGEQLVTLLNYVDVYHNKNIDSSIPQMQVSAPEKKIQACTVEQGDIFVTPTSETIDDIGHSSIITETIPHAVYSYHIMRYRLFEKNMLLSYYINYTFDTYNIKQQILKKAQGLTRFGLSKDKFASILIPIPSLSEQQRIVSILDTFTSSISNLKQQIEERRKQYEYERDLLLDLEGKEGVEMKKLGDCVLLITDGDHQPPPKSSKGIPFVTISDIEKLSHTIDFSNTFFVPQEYYNSLKTDKKAKKGDVLYTVTGSFGIPVLIEDNREFCFQRHIALIRPNNTIALSRYIYHWLCSNYAKKQGEEKASGGAQKTVSLNSLRSFHFYYPSLQAQSRIVSILDTFEQSIANLEEQLAMREKQYEYYRNQLLTFE